MPLFGRRHFGRKLRLGVYSAGNRVLLVFQAIKLAHCFLQHALRRLQFVYRVFKLFACAPALFGLLFSALRGGLSRGEHASQLPQRAFELFQPVKLVQVLFRRVSGFLALCQGMLRSFKEDIGIR